MKFVVKQRRSVKIDGVLSGNVFDDFGRIKEPLSVVFPIWNVICKIAVDATADRIDVNDLGRIKKPLRSLADPLRDVACGYHVDYPASGAPSTAYSLTGQLAKPLLLARDYQSAA